MRWKFNITSLGVSGRAAQRYPVWRVMLESLEVLFITWNEDSVLHFNVNWDRVYFTVLSHSWSLFLSWMFIMNVQHVLTLVPSLEVASWAPAGSNRKPGTSGRQQGPFGHCHHQRTTGLSEWCLTYFCSVLHFIEHIIIPICNESDSERWLFQSHTATKCQNSEKGLLNLHTWHSTKSLHGLKRDEWEICYKGIGGTLSLVVMWFTNHALYYLKETG